MRKKIREGSLPRSGFYLPHPAARYSLKDFIAPLQFPTVYGVEPGDHLFECLRRLHFHIPCQRTAVVTDPKGKALTGNCHFC